MSDHDTQLRALSDALTRDAPIAPPLEDLTVSREPAPISRRQGPRRVLVAAAVVTVLVALVIGLVAANRSSIEPAGPISGAVCFPDPGPFTGPGGQTFGPLTGRSTAESTGWPVLRDEIPDFVRVPCVHSSGVIGWVKKADLVPQLFGEPVESLSTGGVPGTPMCDADGRNVGSLRTSVRYPVFADDGTTVIGHIYPRVGFVALGERVDGYPDRNGLTPCDGDTTALTTQPASSKAQLAWPNAVNYDVTYADLYATLVTALAGDHELAGFHDDGKPTMYGTWSDLARSIAANSAKVRGLPYNPADLLAPLRDEAGRIVGYQAANAPIITVQEASDAAFDLCALQIKTKERDLQKLREMPELRDSLERVPGLVLPLSGSAREGISC